MALAVDATGKTKANPRTGAINGGAAALRQDLGSNELNVTPPPVGPLGRAPLKDQLEQMQWASQWAESRPRHDNAETDNHTLTMAPEGLSTHLGDFGTIPTKDMSSLVSQDWRHDVGDTRSNVAYRNLFGTLGATDEDRESWEQGSWMGSRSGREDAGFSMANPFLDVSIDELTSSAEEAPDFVIDDGTSYDYAHTTSGWMTGPQYEQYVRAGFGGRPVGRIDPTQVYSKWDEMEEYGFRPYSPDELSYAGMAVEDALRKPGEWGKAMANARTDNPLHSDYSITYGPDRTTISGKEFDRLAPAYLNRYWYALNRDPDSYRYVEWQVPDSEGNTVSARGAIVDSGYDGTLHLSFADGYEVDIPEEEMARWQVGEDGTRYVPAEYTDAHGGFEASYDPTLYVTFEDGQRIGLSDDFVLQNTDADGTVILGNIPSEVRYEPPEDLVLSDGTSIPFEDVQRIYYGDDFAGGDDVSYEFGTFGPFSNKPRRLMNQEPVSTDRDLLDMLDTGDLANNVLDWTLGSVPISMGKVLPWVYSMSEAIPSLYGINSVSGSPDTGSYSLNAGGWDDDGNLRYGVLGGDGEVDDDLSDGTRWWNVAGNAAIPLTEMMVGPVGESIIPLERVVGRYPFKSHLGELAAQAMAGHLAEGVEEILGNPFEELMQYGTNAYARPALDGDGNVIKDIYGHEARMPDTDAWSRMQAAADLDDTLNAALGGAAVSGAMSILGLPKLGEAIAADAALGDTGVRKYVETELDRRIREAQESGEMPDLSDLRTVGSAYASQFDDGRRDR